MKKNLLVFLFLSACISYGQTILNAYAKVTAIAGSSVLTLSNVNQANHTLTVGGQVVVMQMQDDVIGTNTSNTSSFGDLSSISSAGLYEVRTIASISPASGTPTSVTLSASMVNTYHIGTHSSVQLISYRYLGTNYTTTASITSPAWDGNVGGVIVMAVGGTLTLNNSVSADGLGFRGGSRSADASGDYSCVNTSYISTVTTLGAKGEGIYLSTVTSYSNGRGKILNGGGGGAENNTGGGGGGNYTAGGGGGLGYSCSTSNSGYGIGGISLSAQISAGRVFMGGGGGGGQGNNGVSTAGGNGGGIILIKANTVATSTTCGSSVMITSNGNTAANSGNDGAGGGGAGGTIVIQTNNYSITAACPMTLSVNGGNGGNVNNSGTHGGGGGGGQGVIVYSTPLPTVNVTTQTNNGAAGSDNSGGTVTGSSGGGTNNTGIITAGAGPLPIGLITFNGIVQGDNVKLTWKTATEKNNKWFMVEKSLDGIGFTTIATQAGALNSSTIRSYEATDYQPASGLNYYRLKQVDTDGSFSYSAIIYVQIDAPVSFVIYPNPVSGNASATVQLDQAISGKLSAIVYDATGKIFLNADYEMNGSNTADIPMPNLENGVYFIRLQNGYSVLVKKLIVGVR